MKIKLDDDEISLKKISNSGQCFRFKDLGDNKYLVISGEKFLVLSQDEDNLSEFFLNISEKDFKEKWRNYFDLGTNYKTIRKKIDKNDKFLYNAGEAGKGVRILKQEKFETLISFIISQRKSIPAIKTSIEKLCRISGKPIGKFKGDIIYSFPTPIDIRNTDAEKLSDCGFGYRLPYILKATEECVENPDLLDKIDELDDDELLKRLKEFYGVGVKVASCTMLFSYHRLNAFPIDVWIDRALKSFYPNGFSFDEYKNYNGVMQQYIFEYFRNKKRSDFV